MIFKWEQFEKKNEVKINLYIEKKMLLQKLL